MSDIRISQSLKGSQTQYEDEKLGTSTGLAVAHLPILCFFLSPLSSWEEMGQAYCFQSLVSLYGDKRARSWAVEMPWSFFSSADVP